MKFLEGEEVTHTLTEVQKGIVRQHLGAHALANKLFRFRYYWSFMVQDANDYIRKYV